MQRLEAAVGEPAVESRWNRTNGVLEESEALLHFVGIKRRDAHDDVRVPVDVLGDGVHHDVRAVVERVLHVGREEGVIHHDHDAVLVRFGGHGADVDEAKGGI